MTLVFNNRTPFEALHFETLDQFEDGFHVFVAKIAYSLSPVDNSGWAMLSEMQEPASLIEEDEYCGEMHRSSIRCESDLAPFKPRCDVILNATAYAPAGIAAPRFSVRLTVTRPDQPAPLPEKPHGLNPLQSPSPQAMQSWRAALESAKVSTVRGETLIDKRLIVTGERSLRKKLWSMRLFQSVLRIATLGLAHPLPWRLESPQPCATLPIRYEFAYGGELRVKANDRAAKQVPQQHRIPSQAATKQAGSEEGVLVAHNVCETNPVGLGYAERWHLQAAHLSHLQGPRIERPNQPFNADLFWKVANGKVPPIEPAGLGCIGRAWLPRRALIGEIDTTKQWQEDEVPNLPPEFDFGYWNAAPRDQQCAHLQGDECFILANLCDSDHPASTTNANGDSLLRFKLPGTVLYLALEDAQGRIAARPLVIDTVLIDPEQGRIDLTWRAVVSTQIELINAELRAAHTQEQRQQLASLLLHQRQAASVEHFTAQVSHGA
jgi:hypothetical protein